MATISHTVTVMTDIAAIAIFDPEIVATAHIDENELDFTRIAPIRNGLAAVFTIGGDGIYQIRITDGDLTPDERDYAAAALEDVRLVVRSGTALVSGYALSLPCENAVPAAIPPGTYTLTAYEIRWEMSPIWRQEDGTTRPDAPADYVLQLRPAPPGPYTLPHADLRLDSLITSDGYPAAFLFPSTTRRVGTEPGMIMVTTVVKSPTGLRLKRCGIEQYEGELSDYSGLNWKDRIRFRVTKVDHARGLYLGELVERIST